MERLNLDKFKVSELANVKSIYGGAANTCWTQYEPEDGKNCTVNDCGSDNEIRMKEDPETLTASSPSC
ncbi:MAG: hypothetical protein AAFY71_27335 [Bacteroidota bacterium]